MGGKQGKAQTTMEIPEWLDTAMKTAVGGGLEDFNKFRQMGMDKIMPNEGYTNVNVQNPWELVGMGNGRAVPDPGPSPGVTPGDGGNVAQPPGKTPGNPGGNRGSGDSRNGPIRRQKR
jgi:hypothetical protein